MSSDMTQQVVAQLVESHARFLEFVERRVGSRAVAEDILQEAFARALSRSDTLRSGESAKAWFYRLLRNALIDHYRRRASEHRALETAANEPEPPGVQTDEALMETVCACMNVLVDTLKPEYGEALRRVDLGEQSLGEYAEQAGINANNASVRLHRAREALYKRLVINYDTCATHRCLDYHCQKRAERP